MIRFVKIVFVLVAMILGTSSCINQEEPNSPIGNNANTKQENIELSIWHIWTTDVDANRITLEAGLEVIQKAYPNIYFSVDATENETYKTRIKTAIAVNDAPDMFFTWGGGFSKTLVNTGKVLCLDEYYTPEVQAQLPKKYLQHQIYNDSIYGLPFMRSYAILYANSKIFKENYLEIPESYDELLNVSKTLSERGITTIGVAGQDMWPLMFHYATLAMHEVGPEAVRKALDGEGTFQANGFIEAADKLLKLKDAGAFGEDCLSLAIDPLASSFKAGEVAMYYHGSWATGGFTADAKASDYIIPYKYPGNGNEYDDTFLGGAVDCWMASVNTEYPDEVASVMIILSQAISTIGAQTGMTLPMWEETANIGKVDFPGLDDADYLQIEGIYNQVSKLTEDVGIENSTLWWDTYLGNKGYECNELIIEMFRGVITPEQFVYEMDNLVRQ